MVKGLVFAISLCFFVTAQPTEFLRGNVSLAAQDSSEEQRKQALETSANALLLLIEKGDPKELVLHFSQEGVIFGFHSPPIPIAALRQEIERKRGIYCVFFDTACFRREDAAARARDGAAPRSEPLYSFRERLARSSSRQVEIGGDFVTIRLSPDVEFPPGSRDFVPIEFQFVFENGRWKVAELPLW